MFQFTKSCCRFVLFGECFFLYSCPVKAISSPHFSVFDQVLVCWCLLWILCLSSYTLNNNNLVLFRISITECLFVCDILMLLYKLSKTIMCK